MDNTNTATEKQDQITNIIAARHATERRMRLNEASAKLFEGAGMLDDAREQRARARGMGAIVKELVGLQDVIQAEIDA
jgi:poly(A) polymerase Pap1